MSLHESVRAELLRRIESGIYPPGAPIPSTGVLTVEFGVSQITVTRALRDLQTTGVLVSFTGKGKYVKKQAPVLRRLDAVSPAIGTTNVQLLSITRERISDPAMHLFEPPREAMLCVRKVVFAHDVPVMYDATYLSSNVEDGIIEEFGEHFVTTALKRHSIDVLNTDIIIDAAPATGKVGEVFGIPIGYPVLRRSYKCATSDTEITLFGVVQAPFDQLACSVSIPSKRRRRLSRRASRRSLA
ncbi:GntR family transcriptional regulator [Bradyrhizobium sp. B097]|uniref:GntR family transcriptional regulator n=1 Tax=Bradyrhizobium sp. B097 TaxID=3140244 RepID=UPI003183ECE2